MNLEFSAVYDSIWQLRAKQLRRGRLAQFICKLSGRVSLPLEHQYTDSGLGELSVWEEEYTFKVATPSLNNTPIDTPNGPAYTGWAFKVKGELPSAMAGDASLETYLRRPPRRERSVQIYRSATDQDTGVATEEKLYDVYLSGTFTNCRDRLTDAEFDYWLDTDHDLPAVVERNETAKLHALSLGKIANAWLAISY